jgi:hypothetical protein
LQGLVLPGRVWKPTITTTTAHRWVFNPIFHHQTLNPKWRSTHKSVPWCSVHEIVPIQCSKCTAF